MKSSRYRKATSVLGSSGSARDDSAKHHRSCSQMADFPSIILLAHNKLAEVLDAAAALLEGWNPPRYEQGAESNNSSSLFFADCARWLLDPQFSLPTIRRKK